ncbi:MAG: calmodulin [Pseudomonadota bacterium]
MKILSVVILGLAASTAWAAEEDGGKSSFDKLDTDRDGVLSAFEAQADTKLLERFTELDANGDGSLSRQEYAAHAKKQ